MRSNVCLSLPVKPSIHTTVHVPGKLLVAADALSRVPIVGELSSEEKELEREAQVFVDAIHHCLPVSQSKLQQIADEQQHDRICRELMA